MFFTDSSGLLKLNLCLFWLHYYYLNNFIVFKNIKQASVITASVTVILLNEKCQSGFYSVLLCLSVSSL